MSKTSILAYPQYPISSGTSDDKRVLVKPYRVKNVVIPSGTRSDGLTLKAKIFRVIVSKYSPKFEPFFFIHDYLCDKEKYELADELGEFVLFDIEYSWRTRLMMKVIRLYHRLKYGVK